MSGACYHLRQLADKEVPGAAKLLDKLEGGKLKSIISKTLMVSRFAYDLSALLIFVFDKFFKFRGESRCLAMVVLELSLHVNVYFGR